MLRIGLGRFCLSAISASRAATYLPPYSLPARLRKLFSAAAADRRLLPTAR
jgi:hypothetical protein